MSDREPRQEVTGDVTGGVIPYKNVPALMAYYCGVFSLIPCVGFPLAVAAVVLGVAGHMRYSKYPQVRGVFHAWVGIVLGALVFIAHIGAAAAVLWLAQRS